MSTVPRILPCVDERTDVYVAYMSPRRFVEFTPAFAQFLATAEVDGRVPILVTDEDAEISPFVALEMGRVSGRWVARRRDGVVIDALTNRVVRSFDEVVDRAANLELPFADLPGPDDRDCTAVADLEIILHHEAREELEVGRILDDVCDLMGRARPDVFGVTEPLTQNWHRGRLTQLARHEMPSSGRFRVGAPGEAWFTLKYDRGPDGVVERVRGWIPLGEWDATSHTASEVGERLLERLHSSYTMIGASVSLMDMDDGGRQGVRRRRMEIPRAIYLGGWALHEAKADVPLLVREYGGRELPGPRRTALLFRFDGSGAETLAAISRAVHQIGVANVMAAVGLEVSDGR